MWGVATRWTMPNTMSNHCTTILRQLTLLLRILTYELSITFDLTSYAVASLASDRDLTKYNNIRIVVYDEWWTETHSVGWNITEGFTFVSSCSQARYWTCFVHRSRRQDRSRR